MADEGVEKCTEGVQGGTRVGVVASERVLVIASSDDVVYAMCYRCFVDDTGGVPEEEG